MATLGSSTPAVSRAGGRRLVVLAMALALGLLYVAYQAWVARRPYEWSGTVEARTISVGSRVGGRVEAVRAKEGDSVLAGQPLVLLEVGDLEAQRLMAKAQLDEARATLDRAKRGARPEEIAQAKARAEMASAALVETRVGARAEQVAGARARLAAAQAAADKASLDVERAKALAATQAISQGALDDALSSQREAVAQRDAATQALQELTNGSRREDVAQALARSEEARASADLVIAGPRVEDIEVAEAGVLSAQGRLDQVDVQMRELVIRAPVAALVESLDLRPGDILAPNATAASLVESDQLYVRIYVPETQVGHVHPGQTTEVTVDSFPDLRFRGVVEHVNAVGEYSPRNLQTADERADQVFAARVGLLEGQSRLRAGMAAFIHVAK